MKLMKVEIVAEIAQGFKERSAKQVNEGVRHRRNSVKFNWCMLMS